MRSLKSWCEKVYSDTRIGKLVGRLTYRSNKSKLALEIRRVVCGSEQ